MAFVKVNRAKHHANDATKPEITMACYLGDSKTKAKSITVRITVPFAAAAGWEINDRRLRIGVLEGTGEDAGFLQLVIDPNGYTAVQGVQRQEDMPNMMGLGFSMTADRFKYYVLNECPVSAAPVNFMLEDNMAIIECPDWLRPNLAAMEHDGVGAKSSQPTPEPEPSQPPPVNRNRHTRRLLGKEIAKALRS